MEYTDRLLADQDTDYQGHSNGQGEQSTCNHTLPAGLIVPPTVLLTELENGTFVLQGRPDGPRGYLSPDDAVALKRELAAAFERAELVMPSDLGQAR